MISAVNGDFELGNIYCFRYRVKLNNPLMGTEIRIYFTDNTFYSFDWVKLNNPLMGTEISMAIYGMFVLYNAMKLN